MARNFFSNLYVDIIQIFPSFEVEIAYCHHRPLSTMIHPHTRLQPVSDSIGLGVFATHAIPAGTIVCVPDKLDIILKPNDPLINHPLYSRLVEKYSCVDEKGSRLLSWDHAKFMNHSCEANTMSTGWGFEIAIADIASGDELTCEYGLLNIERTMACACGTPSCRRAIHPHDCLEYAEQWDGPIKSSLQKLNVTEQALLDFLKPAIRRKLTYFLNTGKSYRSVRNLFFSPVLNQLAAS